MQSSLVDKDPAPGSSLPGGVNRFVIEGLPVLLTYDNRRQRRSNTDRSFHYIIEQYFSHVRRAAVSRANLSYKPVKNKPPPVTLIASANFFAGIAFSYRGPAVIQIDQY